MGGVRFGHYAAAIILFSFVFLNSEATLVRKSKWRRASVLAGAAKQLIISMSQNLLSPFNVLETTKTALTTHRDHSCSLDLF